MLVCVLTHRMESWIIVKLGATFWVVLAHGFVI